MLIGNRPSDRRFLSYHQGRQLEGNRKEDYRIGKKKKKKKKKFNISRGRLVQWIKRSLHKIFPSGDRGSIPAEEFSFSREFIHKKD